MSRKLILLIAAGAWIVGLVLLALYFWRPITIMNGGETTIIRQPVWTVSQALAAAQVTLDPADEVQPGLGQVVPPDGQIKIQRSVQVYLWQNGKIRRLTSFERNPGNLLAAAGIKLYPNDRLLWNGQPVDLNQPLPVGQPILLQLESGPLTTLINNGKQQIVFSAGPTTARLLWDGGIRLGPGDLVSQPAGAMFSPDQPVAYQSARQLAIQVEGRTVQSRSAAATVGEALAQAGVALQGLDYSQPAEDQPLPEDGQIRVVRVREEIVLKQTLLPYDSKTQFDANVELDQRQVTVGGQYGVKVTRERVRYEDGQETARAVDSDWTASEPVSEIVGLGTKIVPHTLDVPGGPIEYWRAIQVYATSYAPCEGGARKCNWTTASGARLTKGMIAVTLPWYRMMAGQRVYITRYGFAVIADVGGGIPGRRWIDLGFDEELYASEAFVGWVTMYFLTPVPANVLDQVNLP